MTNNILNNIDTKEVWIDVETVAKLKDVTKRAVRLSLSNDRYEYKVETVKGGKTYKIKLGSLEEDLQVKYIEEYYNDFKAVDNEIIELSNFNIKQEKLISESQKKIALAKYDLISCWLNYRKDFKKQKFTTSSNPDTQFLELYNTGILHEEIFKTLGKTSIGSLYRWRALLNYNSDWTALVGQYKYSTRKEYNTSLNEEQIKIFLKILLSPNSFSIGKSISLTKHILKERGYEILPKDVTFRRYAVWFRDNNYDKWVLAREGQKALKDKVEPYIVRNASLLKPGQVLIADGHTLNFQVINPFIGRPCRATLLGFLDWKSGGLVGYDIMLEECYRESAKIEQFVKFWCKIEPISSKIWQKIRFSEISKLSANLFKTPCQFVQYLLSICSKLSDNFLMSLKFKNPCGFDIDNLSFISKIIKLKR